MIFDRLKLAGKLTLLLSVVFISAIFLSGMLLSRTTYQKAEHEVLDRSQIVMAMMNSVRRYTDVQINPLLKNEIEVNSNFIPQAIPTFSAREVFESLRESPQFQHYLYKDAVINPTNLRDLADEFEVEIVQQFRADSNLESVSGFRTISQQKLFYNARPIVITQASCLRCHSTPEEAPQSMIATYGPDNGFGWPLNKVLGIQVVYVPSEDVFQIAHTSLALVMGIFVGIFAIVISLINFFLKKVVLRPIQPMARLAQKISGEQIDPDRGGDLDRSDVESLGKYAKSSDELGQLAGIFQQMAQAIYIREQSFIQQLQQLRNKSEQQQADRHQKKTELAYLKALQQKAKMIRSRANGSQADRR